MNIVIEELYAFRQRLQKDMALTFVEQKKALSEIDTAIGRLKFCERYGIYGDAEVINLPRQGTMTPSSEYRIVEDHETEDRSYWTEIIVDGEKVRAHMGDLILKLSCKL